MLFHLRAWLLCVADEDEKDVPPELTGEARAAFIAERRAMRRLKRAMGQYGDGTIGPVDELRLQAEARRRAELAKLGK